LQGHRLSTLGAGRRFRGAVEHAREVLDGFVGALGLCGELLGRSVNDLTQALFAVGGQTRWVIFNRRPEPFARRANAHKRQ
jgi:hypothetical protein